MRTFIVAALCVALCVYSVASQDSTQGPDLLGNDIDDTLNKADASVSRELDNINGNSLNWAARQFDPQTGLPSLLTEIANITLSQRTMSSPAGAAALLVLQTFQAAVTDLDGCGMSANVEAGLLATGIRFCWPLLIGLNLDLFPNASFYQTMKANLQTDLAGSACSSSSNASLQNLLAALNSAQAVSVNVSSTSTSAISFPDLIASELATMFESSYHLFQEFYVPDLNSSSPLPAQLDRERRGRFINSRPYGKMVNYYSFGRMMNYWPTRMVSSWGYYRMSTSDNSVGSYEGELRTTATQIRPLGFSYPVNNDTIDATISSSTINETATNIAFQLVNRNSDTAAPATPSGTSLFSWQTGGLTVASVKSWMESEDALGGSAFQDFIQSFDKELLLRPNLKQLLSGSIDSEYYLSILGFKLVSDFQGLAMQHLGLLELSMLNVSCARFYEQYNVQACPHFELSNSTDGRLNSTLTASLAATQSRADSFRSDMSRQQTNLLLEAMATNTAAPSTSSSSSSGTPGWGIALAVVGSCLAVVAAVAVIKHHRQKSNKNKPVSEPQSTQMQSNDGTPYARLLDGSNV